MADNAEENTPESVADRLAASLAAFDPGLPEGTVLRFRVTAQPNEEYKGDSWVVTAVWGKGTWQVTPGCNLIAGRATPHHELMQNLAKLGATEIELASAWEPLR